LFKDIIHAFNWRKQRKQIIIDLNPPKLELGVVNTSQVNSCLCPTCKDQHDEIWQICDGMIVNDTGAKFVNF
jgi:hypothetical protein